MATYHATARDMTQMVALQQPIKTEDDNGQPVLSWSTVAAVWAKVTPLRGREFFAAQAAQSEAVLKITINWRAGVTSEMRVLWRDVPYVLVADPMDIEGGRRTLELMCAGGPKAS